MKESASPLLLPRTLLRPPLLCPRLSRGPACAEISAVLPRHNTENIDLLPLVVESKLLLHSSVVLLFTNKRRQINDDNNDHHATSFRLDCSMSEGQPCLYI